MSNSFELTPQSETLALYNSLSPWLKENGQLTVDEQCIPRGLHLGAWIIQGIVPSYDFSVRASIIANQAQGANQVFCIGGQGALLSYSPEHYMYDEEEALAGVDPDFTNPTLRLLVPAKKQGCSVDKETLTISHHIDTNEIYISRLFITRDPMSDQEIRHQQPPVLQGQPGSLRSDEFEALGQLHDLIVTAPNKAELEFMQPWQDMLLQQRD